jgi:CheY-like chemotaxis protein
MLPKVTGRELLKYTRDDPDLRSIPSIIETAQSEVTNVIADEVFIKPVDVARLLDSVRRLVLPR